LAERAALRCELLALLCVGAARSDAERIAAGRCPVLTVGAEELSRTAGYPFHRGLMAAARRPAIPALREAHAATVADSRAPGFSLASADRIVVLPSTADPENLGALVRTAAALGWDAVLLGPGCCDPFGRRALRCSMGAVLSMPLFRFEDSADLRLLAGEGWTAVAASLEEGAKELGSLGRVDRLALVLGNEREGIPAEVRSVCAPAVAIPQGRTEAEGVDSLNVAAAEAILLWEGRRGG
jgi:tRNA G18 (ribose-2'-O)-methylase SpoU